MKFLIAITLLFYTGKCFSQTIVKTFCLDSAGMYLKGHSPADQKIIPVEYADAISIALMYYPELAHVKIKFRIKDKRAPLAARPTLFSIFLKPAKRTYLVTISSSTVETFSPILLKNLSFNSQVGVLGHELAHITEYNSKKGIFFLGLALKHLSKKSIDRFEYNTDKRCIEHKLGYQLLSWSQEVRKKLQLGQWGGANHPEGKRERYMNPETIIATMKLLSFY